MENLLLILFGKFIGWTLRILRLGSGSTWPGHIALSVNENFVKDMLYRNSIKLVFIAGTNGKTTTATLIKHILEEANYRVLHNKSGANLENGLASVIIEGADFNKKISYDYLIFETDENTLPALLKKFDPNYLILLNLFRDQLDRYGELHSIVDKWEKSISKLTSKTALLLNADDPQIYYLPHKSRSRSFYFGLNIQSEKTLSHSADSIFCPKCNTKLSFAKIFYSHLGVWKCSNCGLKRPRLNMSSAPYYPLEGIYNYYNAIAANMFAKLEKIPQTKVNNVLKNFQPAFGRQEKISLNNKNVQIFLSKNPISFNESLGTINEHLPKNLLFVLNDRIPDGLDISWVWDTNIESFLSDKTKIFISGDRVWDMNLRLKYAGLTKRFPYPDLSEAIQKAIESTKDGETLYILPNYSAMLEVRKILTGKKIL